MGAHAAAPVVGAADETPTGNGDKEKLSSAASM